MTREQELKDEIEKMEQADRQTWNEEMKEIYLIEWLEDSYNTGKLNRVKVSFRKGDNPESLHKTMKGYNFSLASKEAELKGISEEKARWKKKIEEFIKSIEWTYTEKLEMGFKERIKVLDKLLGDAE